MPTSQEPEKSLLSSRYQPISSPGCVRQRRTETPKALGAGGCLGGLHVQRTCLPSPMALFVKTRRTPATRGGRFPTCSLSSLALGTWPPLIDPGVSARLPQPASYLPPWRTRWRGQRSQGPHVSLLALWGPWWQEALLTPSACLACPTLCKPSGI